MEAQADVNRADINRVASGSNRARVPGPGSYRFSRLPPVSTLGRLRHAGGGARRVPTVGQAPSVARAMARPWRRHAQSYLVMRAPAHTSTRDELAG